MSDRHLEELSALMDGEASELEVRRVLGNLEKDPAMGAKWARYQLTSSILRGETHGKAMQLRSVDLASRVAAAIEAEPVIQSVPARKRFNAGLIKPFANVAVAASVSAAVILGWQSYQGQVVNMPGPVASVTPGGTVLGGSGGAGNGFMQVSQTSSPTVRSSAAIPRADIIRYNPEVDDQLNEYLISHSSNAAVNTASGIAPYARVVGLKPASQPHPEQ